MKRGGDSADQRSEDNGQDNVERNLKIVFFLHLCISSLCVCVFAYWSGHRAGRVPENRLRAALYHNPNIYV